MSKFQSAIGTISALLTISVTVGTVYYNVENKKSQDVTQQQQIDQLRQKLNESAPVAERPSDTYEAAPEPTTIPIPTSPEPPVAQLTSPPVVPPAPTLPPAPPAEPPALQSTEVK